MNVADKLKHVAENMQKVYDAGKAAGGYTDGYEAGRKAEYDRFWDLFQENGKRGHYAYAFYRWTDEIFTPKYDIAMTLNAFFVFYASKITVVNAKIIAADVTLDNTFGNCQIHTITYLQLADVTRYNATFTKASKLQNLNIVGTIGQNGFNVSACPLTHSSLMSIINALKDYSGSGATYTVTLGTANLAKLTTAEKAVATQKGWTLA